MADIHGRWLHTENEKDMLKYYLVSDIVRMLLEANPSLNCEEEIMRMLCRPSEELIELHARMVSESVDIYQQEDFNNGRL